jgi:hypothetical protein
VADVDDLGDTVIDNKPIEHRHLALDIVEVGDGRQARQIVIERVSTGIEIEHQGIIALEAQEIDEEPRHEGLADLRPRRCYDEDRRLFFFDL